MNLKASWSVQVFPLRVLTAMSCFTISIESLILSFVPCGTNSTIRVSVVFVGVFSIGLLLQSLYQRGPIFFASGPARDPDLRLADPLAPSIGLDFRSEF